MSRACIYLLIITILCSVFSSFQILGSCTDEMKILGDVDYSFIDSDSLNQSGTLIRRYSHVKDFTGIRYIRKYSSTNFPFFNFRINRDSVYHKLSEFHSDQAKELFVLAKNDQFNSDSLSREVNILYSKQGIYKDVDKDLFERRVADLEQRASELKKNAVQKAKHALFLEQSPRES